MVIAQLDYKQSKKLVKNITDQFWKKNKEKLMLLRNKQVK